MTKEQPVQTEILRRERRLARQRQLHLLAQRRVATASDPSQRARQADRTDRDDRQSRNKTLHGWIVTEEQGLR